MTLLAPWALLALLGWIPVVAMYVLRARRTRVRVPSTWLWQTARRDQQVRTPWKRLTPETSLVLELLGVAALALALARPAWRAPTGRHAHAALVLDVSASMQAGSRMALARARAHRWVDALSPDADAMVIEAGQDARVAQGSTDDRRRLHRVIDAIEAVDVEGSVAAGAALALDRLRAQGGDRAVHVITDGAVARDAPLTTDGVTVTAERVGEATDNAALVRVDVRTARSGDAEQVQVFALVANFGVDAVTVTVRASRDDVREAPAQQEVTVAPGGRVPVVLTRPLRDEDVGHGLRVELTPHDALPVDDVAFARIPPGARIPVVHLATTADPWIDRALAADPAVDLRAGDADSPDALPDDALVIYEGACPAALPDRELLILAPPAGACAGGAVLPRVESPAITSYVTSDARFRFLTMDGVHLSEATPLRPGPRWTELLRAGSSVLLADAGDARHHRTVVGLDVAHTDWPLRASFVLFLRNVVEMARARRAWPGVGGGRAGEPLRVTVPEGTTSATAEGPEGTVPASVTQGAALVGDTRRAGMYTVRWRGGSMRWPVNLLSEAESDLRRAPWSPTLTDRGARPVRRVPAPEEFGALLCLAAALAMLADRLWLDRGRARREVRP